MKNNSLLGSWIKRFLLEHLVAERNLARNTQQSYRDTLRLLLPHLAAHSRKHVDTLEIGLCTRIRRDPHFRPLSEER
jgi:integrase/recombinase XerD